MSAFHPTFVKPGLAPLVPLLTAFSLGLTWACVSVLGIEDAECDGEFAPTCRRGGEGGGMSSNIASASTGSGGAGVPAALVAGAAGRGPPVVEEPPRESTCEEYCRVVGQRCVGVDQQYASADACLSVCALLDRGERGDAEGNTVHCRLTLAELAASTGEPDDYCFSAGPGGAGVCGSDCEGFCTIMTAKCDEMGPLERCLVECASVPDLSLSPTLVTYDTSFQSGDSIQCRLFHVSAASIDPVGHCVHAAGLAVCNAPSAMPPSAMPPP